MNPEDELNGEEPESQEQQSSTGSMKDEGGSSSGLSSVGNGNGNGNGSDGVVHISQLHNGEGVLAEEQTSSSSSGSEGPAPAADSEGNAHQKRTKPKKPKSDKSVVHDKDKGICRCKHCEWIYPNPRPSARQRREHRKHCGKFQNVHAWLGTEPETGQVEEETGTVEHEGNHQEQGIENLENPSLEGPHEMNLTEIAEERKGKEAVKAETNGDLETEKAHELCSSNLEAGKVKPETSAVQQEYDLAKVLKEQRTHDLVCPNCGSCITKRVILRKRKRTVASSSEEQQEKLPKVEQESRTDEEVEDSEAWGCLACLAIFFPRVRGLRFSWGAPQDESEGRRSTDATQDQPGGETVVQERAQHFSCMPYLLPDFHWDGEGLVSQRSDRQGSSCLPLEFPWMRKDISSEEQASQPEDREIEIVIDLTQPESEAPEYSSHSSCFPFSKQAEGTQVQDRGRFNCLPTSWGQEEQSSAELPKEEDTGKAGLNCLPNFFASYTSKSSTTVAVQKDGERQEVVDTVVETGIDPVPVSTNEMEIPSVQSEEQITADRRKAGFNCLQDCFPLSQRSVESRHPEQVSVTDQGEQDQKGSSWNCLPALVPDYSWGPKETPQEHETVEDGRKAAAFDCLPGLLPAYSWGVKPDGYQQSITEVQDISVSEHKGKEKAEIESHAAERPKADELKEDKVCLPIGLPNYSWRWVSKDGNEGQVISSDNQQKTFVQTRIQTWIRTITNVVTIRPASKKSEENVDTVQVGNETSFLDITMTEQADGTKTLTQEKPLGTQSSTGWAMVDAMGMDKPSITKIVEATSERPAPISEEEEDETAPLINNRKKLSTQTEIEEIKSDRDIPEHVQVVKPQSVSPPVRQINQHLDDLRQPLITADTGVDDLIGKKVEPGPAPSPPVTVSVKTPDTVVQVKGDDPMQAIDTALGLSQAISDTPPQPPRDHVQEYVKSIVYGGLDVTLTSLALVSSAAGSGTKTINIFALSLANLIAGLISLFHNIGSLYQSDRPSFEQYIGQHLWINGSISVVSFFVFGCIAPLTYTLSFRASGDRDYKFALTAMVSLACLCLLGLGKAYVQKKRYSITIINLVLTGFVASIAGYFVGDYIKRWLHKLGYDEQSPPPPPPQETAPPSPFPFFLDRQGLDLGRRGRSSMY